MSPDQITVRLCTTEDLDALHARETHPTARHAQRHFDRQVAGMGLFAVAQQGDSFVGSCALDCDPENKLCPELLSLWVYPEYRRQGAARKLTTFLEEQAAALGFDEVFLRVNPENEAAIPMYIGLEYSPTGDHQLTAYDIVDADGVHHATEQFDAVYRKSLRTR
ncbi:MAG: GNAT family N-acetyltransferase [Propionicimonas sp.]